MVQGQASAGPSAQIPTVVSPVHADCAQTAMVDLEVEAARRAGSFGSRLDLNVAIVAAVAIHGLTPQKLSGPTRPSVTVECTAASWLGMTVL